MYMCCSLQLLICPWPSQLGQARQEQKNLPTCEMLLKNSEALQKGESMGFFAMLCNFEVLNFFHFSLLGQLLSFTDQLFQGQPCGELKWSIPSSTESGMSACPFSMHSATLMVPLGQLVTLGLVTLVFQHFLRADQQ